MFVLIVTFNQTTGYLDGWYTFEDRRSDGNSTTGRLYVRPDNHTMMSNATDLSNTNDLSDSAAQQTELEAKPNEDESGTVFMLLSAASGFAALSILLIMLREFRGSETTSDSEE